MILQLVKLDKLKTDDGMWDISDSDLKVGEQFWIQPSTLHVQQIARKGTTERHPVLVVFTDERVPCPVELLAFTNQFQIK